MKTIETVVYDFDELSDEAKQKAIDKWYENEDYPWLEDDMAGFLSENDPYFCDKKIQYSLSYCQGDGLSFESKFDLEKWLKDKGTVRASFIPVLVLYLDIRSHGNNSNYYSYARRDQIEMNIDTYKSNANFDALCESILRDVQDYYMELCKKAEKYGYDILEYRMTEQEFSELCQANEYTFLPDGTMKNF